MFQTPGFYGISVCQIDFGNVLRSPGRIQSFPGKLSRLCCITVLRTRRKWPSLHLEHAAKWAPVEGKLWNARRDAQLRFQRTQPRPHHQWLRRWSHQIMGYEYSSIMDNKTKQKREKEKLVFITFVILYKKKNSFFNIASSFVPPLFLLPSIAQFLPSASLPILHTVIFAHSYLNHLITSSLH